MKKLLMSAAFILINFMSQNAYANMQCVPAQYLVDKNKWDVGDICNAFCGGHYAMWQYGQCPARFSGEGYGLLCDCTGEARRKSGRQK